MNRCLDMVLRGVAWAGLLFAGLALGVAPVYGQTADTARARAASVADTAGTRADRLRAQRQSKTIQYADSSLLAKLAVRIEGFVERNQIVIDVPTLNLGGLRPVLGGLRGGAGTTGGLRYEFHDAPRRSAYVEALASLRRYYGFNAVYGYEERRLVGYGFARFWHMPQEAFYGVGAGAPDREAVFGRDESITGGLVGISLAPSVMVGGYAAYMTQRVGPGQGDEPTVRSVFDPSEIPGFGADADFATVSLWAEYDTRDIPYVRAYGSRFAPTEDRLRGVSLDATEGFYAAAELTPHVTVGTGQYNFLRAEAELQQYIPFRYAFQVLALRQFISLAQPWPGHEVPFYLMQTLGGSSTLRGYSGFRFRDRHAVLLNAEYRWQVMPPLGLALFLDAGHVFDALPDIGYQNLRAGYGLGVRLKSDERVVLRFDVAYGQEGLKTYFKIGSVL